MRRLNTLLLCIALVFGFSACIFNSSNQSAKADAKLSKNLVGSYYHIQILSEDESDFGDFQVSTIESVEKFNADKSCTEETVLKGVMFDEDWDEYDMELKIVVSGTWSVVDSCIQYNYALDQTTLELVEPNITDPETKAEVTEYLSQFLLPSIKEELQANEQKPPKIVEINKIFLVVRFNDGEETTLLRQ
ncbi:MAG: hypothetical protein LBC84_07040 [Prevotellaceae bacterium]|jgi:hypothetical protein|nr:hypothetical protein [Prevotellaceae bacterium]